WQGRVRVAVAVLAGGAALILQESGVLHGDGAALVGSIIGYVAMIGLLTWQIRRTGVAGNSIVATTVLSDLLFIFSSTIFSAPAGHYDRILILSFFVLHLTESYFGRRHAGLALIAVVAGYLSTIASVVFIVQYGSFQRRLERIVELFEGAEESDFTEEYDLVSDKTPDAITRVGRAYNRVRVQLASMVLTDPLTGCLNRRGLDQALAREISRATRAGSELALLAVDLDHFKEVNDNYGHIAGDLVLREFGSLLAQTARAGDIMARTGGEEFSVLLPDTDPAGAYRAGVRLCDTVRSHPFMLNGKRIALTISVGVVSLSSGGHDVASEDMKECADAALYAAKRGGRDRVRVWNGDRINGEVGVATSGGSLLVARATQPVRGTEHRAAL